MKKKNKITTITRIILLTCLLFCILTACDFGSAAEENSTPTYTVTWKNYDGTVLETDTEVEENSEPSYDGQTPVKEGNDDYAYVFNGWSPVVDFVTEDITYIAEFTAKNKYTITWANPDGTVLKTEKVAVGTVPSYGVETPTKESTDEYTYTFNKWSPSVYAVTKDETYTALYKKTKNKYTVTWKNYDETILKEDLIEYGTKPSYTGKTPTKNNAGNYYYTFSCWSPTVENVTGDVTYIAQFTEIEKYTVIWKNYDGTVLETDTKVEKGTEPSYDGKTPTKNNVGNYYYTFSCWSPTVENVTGDVTYIAQFSENPIEYSISYSLDGGTNHADNPEKYTVESADIILQQPTKLNYRFKGWTGTDLSQATMSVTIPTGSTGDRSYTATWALCIYHKYVDEYTCHDRTCIYCGVETKATTEHDWQVETGVCGDCGYACVHEYESGVCTICGYTHTAHTYADTYTCHNRWCTVCHYLQVATTEHNLDSNCLCSVCKDYSHNYGEDNKCTRCQHEREYTRDGDYIYFGSYPQSKVTDTQITTALSTASENGTWISYKYYISGSNSTDFMWYQDVEYSGEKYRGVYFTSYRTYYCDNSSSESNMSHQDDNGYTTSTVYWFKFEPIKWRILKEADGYATILAELILDSQQYDYDGSYSNNYANSTIRAWLNDTFYNTAFTSLQKGLIQTVEVDNSARSTNPDNNATKWNNGENSYACENTDDKVWLLSRQEVTKSAYGFSTEPSDWDSARKKQTSDYAQIQGAYTYGGKGYWWLRSPRSYNSSFAWLVNYDGLSSGCKDVKYAYFGVVPALKIKLS